MDTRPNKKWILIAAAVLVISVPAGLWMTRSSLMKGSDAPSSESSAPEGQEASDEVALEDSTTEGGVSRAKGSKKGTAVTGGSSTTSQSTTESQPQGTTGVIPSSPDAAVSGTDQTGSATQTQVAKETAKEADGCVTLSYRHKKTPGHNSDDSCSRHKNLIQLKHVAINPSSICVRVNKRPVAFQTVKGHADQILIGAVAGPNTDITVRYCLGKTKCAEDCTVPKDEFLAAIGGGDMDAPVQLAQWDPNSAGEKEADVNGNLDKDIRNELERLDEARPDSRLAATFKDWIAGAETPACVSASGARQAMK